MSENPFRSSELGAGGSPVARTGRARWRVWCCVPLVLLNLCAAVVLLSLTWAAYREAMNGNASMSGTLMRDVMLCMVAVLSALGILTATVSGLLRLWVERRFLLLLSGFSAVVALSAQIAICATLFLNPTRGRGCFGGLAALGEALIGLLLVAGGVVVFCNSAGLLWLTAAKGSQPK